MAEIAELNKQHPLYQEDLNTVLSITGIGELRDKSFLITGATGLIGTFLIDSLMQFNKHGGNVTVYAVGRSKEKASSRLGEYYSNSHFCFIEQDVRMPLPEGVRPDIIIPLASNTHPMAYSQYPIETIEINYLGAAFALKKAVECNAMILYPSTVEVYGNSRGEDVITEEFTGSLVLSTARSCYTESKRVSEALCQSFISEKGLDVKIVRLSRVFGPTMLMGDTKASSQFIIKALRGEDIILKSKGEQFFSYTYVADAVAAILFVLIHGEVGKAYNIANEKCNVHLKEFAETCASIAHTKVVFDLPNEVEQKGFSVAMNAILCTDRLKEIGFKPFYSFESAVERTIEILCQYERNDS